jgi:tRNA-dihydrouridine synthase
MFNKTGCDAVAIARGALGNPYIFSEIKAKLEGKSYTPPSPRERIEEALREVATRIEDKGEYAGIRESRVHLAHFTKSLRGSAAIRGKINFIDSFDELSNTLLSYIDELDVSENL